MASFSTPGGVTINKGDNLTVEVEESLTGLISVRFSKEDKLYRGVLLQEDSSLNHYGINEERIVGAPFWPPLNTGVGNINLKTIPCSTERYSYKYDGQASNLNVFQPEAIKRSHRNQPAPQLSRILRPRRFVCRKCKKAYHVEENGEELSSTALSKLADSTIPDDHSTANSDSETNMWSSCPLASSKTTSTAHHSIRRVTPSIIPKLNEDFALSGRESEVDSNSEDVAITKRQKKSLSLDRTPTVPCITPAPPHTVSNKRKGSTVGLIHRPKKLKRSSHAALNAPVEPTVNSASQKLPESNEPPQSLSTPTEQRSSPGRLDPPLPETSVVKSSMKSESPQIRKNRIKAQYVSVATPFRFPPSRSSKPNLFATVQVAGNSKSKQSTGNHRRMARTGVDPTSGGSKKSIPAGADTSPSQSASLKKSNFLQNCDSEVKKSSVDSQDLSTTSPRSRTRAHPTSVAADISVLGVVSNSLPHVQPEGNVDSSVTPKNSDHGTAANQRDPSRIPNDCDPKMLRDNGDAVSDTPSANSESNASSGRSLPDHSSGEGRLITSSGQGDGAVLMVGRARATDYEKPKNRWIREARARRSQEERGASGSNPIVPVVSSNPLSSANSPNDLPVSSSINAVSPAMARLRVRSSETMIPITAADSVAQTSPKTVSPVQPSKRRNIQPNTTTSGDVVVEDTPNFTASGAADVTPCSLPTTPTQGSDHATTGLPVIKIKINRQHQPSSSTTLAQYEVVGVGVPQKESGQASVSASSKTETEASLSTEDEFKLTIQHPDESYNGLWSPSLSPSASTRKGTSSNSPVLGHLVKRCKLPNGVIFRVGDLVWSKLSGWPYWPAQITNIHRVPAVENDSASKGTVCSETDRIQSKSTSPTTSSSSSSKTKSYTACVRWFAWHQVSYMPCDKLYHFLQHYKRFDNKKKKGVFRQAVNEARQTADKTLDNPVSSGEDESDIESRVDSPVTNTFVGETAAVNNISSNKADNAECIKSTADVNVGSPPQEALDTTSGDSLEIAATASEQAVSLSPKFSGRRGNCRGQTRGFKGRRGNSICLGERVRSSPRNLTTFIPSDQSRYNLQIASFPNSHVVVSNHLSSRNIRRGSRGRRPRSTAGGRGRGRSKKEVILSHPLVEASNPVYCNTSTSISPLVTDVTPPQSSGRLKIVLSTAGIGKHSKQHSKGITNKRRVNKIKKSQRVSSENTVASDSQHIESGSKLAASTTSSPDPTTATVSQEAVVTKLSPTTSSSYEVVPLVIKPDDNESAIQSSYGDPSAELISQFPHVFPDLRASGILSDSVEIPTFSEDESEEEDAGRLIIDPDVMASVNVSLTTFTSPQPSISHKTSIMSNIPPCLNSTSSSTQIPFSSSSNSILPYDEHRSGFGPRDSIFSSTISASNPVSIPTSFSASVCSNYSDLSTFSSSALSAFTPTTTALQQSTYISSQQQSQEIPKKARSLGHSLLLPPAPSQTKYLLPSSRHTDVASVASTAAPAAVAPNAVPYVHSDYTAL
ncbi:unnamed protein product [Calicophoron daubneyi]|uniref:PWWP domain-containing protein n=1 Tax=Calicophoron daubneyi TaxID=300641 RepID=A0AAV2TNU8_CALDB